MLKEEVKNEVLEVAKLLDDRKARDILIIDIEKEASYTDYFIIATCTSSTQISFLSKEIKSKLSQKGWYSINPISYSDSSPWIVLDYSDFVVHLFLEETREYYQLEKIWHEAEVVYKS